MTDNQTPVLSLLMHMMAEILVRMRTGQRGRNDCADAIIDEESRRFLMNTFPPVEFFGADPAGDGDTGLALAALPTSYDAG